MVVVLSCVVGLGVVDVGLAVLVEVGLAVLVEVVLLTGGFGFWVVLTTGVVSPTAFPTFVETSALPMAATVVLTIGRFIFRMIFLVDAVGAPSKKSSQKKS